MIKVNLLPSYIAEFRRMKMWAIIFAILFVLQALIVFGWQDGLKKQTAWFANDQRRCEDLTAKYQAYKAEADMLATNAKVYDEWLKLFKGLQPVKDYDEAIRISLREAAMKLGGSGSMYKEITVTEGGDVNASGQIKGSLQFLNYYFRMTDQSFTLSAAAQSEKPLSQIVNLSVTGKVAPLPQTSGVIPKQLASWKALFIPAGGNSAAGGAGAAAAAPPAGAPAMPGAPAGAPAMPGAPAGAPAMPAGAPPPSGSR